MNIPAPALVILTLGRFSITFAGKPVATDWPNEAVKLFFCSLLSPLDLSFSWDRICRSIWSEPATDSGRRRLDENFIRPLTGFLLKEFGFTPLTTGHEGILFDRQRISVDAHEFHKTVLEGLKLQAIGSRAAAVDKFTRAVSLYAGSYLPGMPGKIIENARRDLELLHQTAVMQVRGKPAAS